MGEKNRNKGGRRRLWRWAGPVAKKKGKKEIRGVGWALEEEKRKKK